MSKYRPALYITILRYIRFLLLYYIPYMLLALPWRLYPESVKNKTLEWRMKLRRRAERMIENE